MANTTVYTGTTKKMRQQMYTVVEAAKILKLAPSTVRMYCFLGSNPNHEHHGVRLEAVKVGQTYLISPETLEAYRAQRRPAGRPKAPPEKKSAKRKKP